MREIYGKFRTFAITVILMHRTYIYILLALVLVCAGCREQKQYRIGVSQYSSDDWRQKMNAEIERELMFHPEAQVEIRSAEDDNARQIADIRYFADNGFDIIIAAPNEAEALTPVIGEIYNKGIPVIIFDRNINSPHYTARIGADDEGLGRLAARYAFAHLPQNPKAIEIYGLKGATPAMGRHKGFVDEFAKGGGELLATAYGDWNQDDAERVTDSLLTLYPDVNLIYAHNDRMAIGGSHVARRHGRDGIMTIGIDAAPTIGIQAVADSVIDATFFYPTEGDRLIRTALAILKGDPYQKLQIIPASPAVDRSNASLLLRQNEEINDETAKLGMLKTQLDDYYARHSMQTTLMWASLGILVLLCMVLFLLLRAFWQRKRTQAVLQRQNQLLEQERDRQKELNAQLEEATQSKLTFFTNVSHDLRTPLTLIAEPVRQLSSAPNLTAPQKTLITLASKNIGILMRLINTILDFRRYERGKLELHRQMADVSGLVREWAESFRSLAQSKRITLNIDVPDTQTMIAVDTEKLERIVFNLVSNAFKYTPAGGRVTVCLKTDDTSLTLSVADTGRGISAEDLPHIFDRFFQTDRVHPQGSGIGLALVKAFAELHGGHVSATSEGKDRGTTLTVTLPITQEVELSEPAKPSPAPKAPEMPVITAAPQEISDDKPILLVIDDNEDIRTLLQTLLSAEYNVITATGGEAGLKAAAAYVPDLIICDVMMPGMDGYQCTRRLKEDVATSHIPVLLLTACSMDEQRTEGYRCGADGYLSKPFDAEMLRARCASLIANRKRIQTQKPSQSPKELAELKRRTEAAAATGQDIDDAFYQRFITIFDRDIADAEAGVDHFAAELGLGHSQFYRKIKALTGYSPVELMRRLRLERARTMLADTDRTVSEISYAVGFSTPAYFTKCYREQYGQTPTEARTGVS